MIFQVFNFPEFAPSLTETDYCFPSVKHIEL
jgi:hypothetical protein